MQVHFDLHRRVNHGTPRGRGLKAGLIGVGVIAAMAVCGFARLAAAQDSGALPGFEGGPMDSGVAPMSNFGGGSFFSQDLGTVLRLRYNTESYGQDDQGNLDIGTMQVLNFDDSIGFFDGQLTLNDTNGAGFNIGLGYRWLGMVPYSTQDPMVVNGLSVWADGTSTEANNFFPQVGVSYESLGDLWDLRANGYIPLGSQEQTGKFTPTGEIGFDENFIAEVTRATVDSSFYAADAEVARRLGAERDAWAFAGPYFLANDDDDTIGYRAGMRGYAYPDLLLQIAVTHDEIFDTNAAFSVTWFVGRTRTNFQPACGVPDRMREPVLRNDYVALAKRTTFGGIPLNDPDGDPLRVVHVDSNAAPGGDGTFERPLNLLGEIDDNSQDGDIVLVHSQSVFTGQAGAILQDNQRFLGEGNDFDHTVATQEDGIISIPESSPGAKALPRPMILAAIGDAVTLADANEVANFDIDGQGVTARAIVAGPDGAGNPGLRELSIKNTTGDAIVTTPFVRVDPDNANLKTVAGSVTIDNVVFDNIGGNEISIDSATTEDVTSPNVTLQETITISNVTSTNGDERGIFIQNTHTAANGRATTITNYTYDGDTTSQGAVLLTNFDGAFTMSTSTLTNGATTGFGFQILGASDGTFTINDTVTMDSIDGTTFDIDGRNGAADEFTGVATLRSDIASDSGRSVSIQGISGAGTSVTLIGDITETLASQGIFANRNSGGIILFSGDVTQTLSSPDGIRLTNNTGADINFGGALDITMSGAGNGFTATGGGTLTASNTNNQITTETGQIVVITDMTISTAGVNFPEVNRTAGAASNAVLLQNNTGGPILVGTVGDDAGESGTIVGGTVDAIVIQNSANVTVSGLKINNTSAVSGVRIEKPTATAMTVNLNDLEINDGDIGLEVNGGGTTANLTMTLNDTNALDSTDVGMSFNDVDTGTIGINNALIDGNGAAATAGVRIQNSNATFNLDAATRIQEVVGAEFLVDGGTGNVNMAGDVTNTVGRSVVVQGVTGGSVTFSSASSITDTGEGMLVKDNSGGSFSFLGANDFDTTTFDAVTLDTNPGATMTFAGLNINSTGTGRAFIATAGGTVSVTGTTNIIETDDGLGLQIEDMIIGAVDFQRVTVNDGAGGPMNAIILKNLTGGQVAVGTTTGAQNSGGVLRSTGDAIVLENVQNVDLRDMQIISAGGIGLNVRQSEPNSSAMDVTVDNLNLDDSAGNGVQVAAESNSNSFIMRFTNGDLEENYATSVTGTALFQMRVETTSITINSGTTDAFSTTLSVSATNADMILNDVNFASADASALFIDMSGGTAKTLDLLVQDSDFSNNSAANPASDIQTSDSSTLSATIQGNTFANLSGGAGASDFLMTANGAAARVRLNLGGDTAADFNSANGVGIYDLVEVPGGADFDVFEKDDTFNLNPPTTVPRNNGTVSPQSPAGVPNAAAFDDLPVAPVPPVIP